MIFKFVEKTLLPGLFLLSFIGLSQEYNTFDIRYQNNIKGDLTFIANQIVNRDGGTATTRPEDAYNNLSTNGSLNTETGGHLNYNDNKNMQYVDVDPDPTTFSSSSANFNFPNPNCNIIRYAGLYWSATYPSATANGFYDGFTYNANTIPVGTGRQNDFDHVKFKVPGGAYVDIVADEILFDGFTSTDPSILANSPYACYADVTALMTAMADPTGDYTIANVRSVTGLLAPGGGAAAGWTLVIVYENPTLTGKLITTYDGFARVTGTNNVPINYTGFNTIPVGPVNADIGAATLEGDFRITGDQMRIRAASNPSFVPMNNGVNPVNNFFNSNITLNGALLPGRTPSSANTLGYDTDIFQLNNFGNSVIPNGETAATFQFATNGDQYYPFFNSFSVEIIEPDIILEKKVEDIAGNDITGLGVNLGQTLDYVLSFQNIGNDDGTNHTIRDVLPINITLDELNFVLPPGVTYTYDSVTRTAVFTIPDNIIKAGDPTAVIRMRIKVAENCFDFIDACTDQIENLAYSTYQGVINNNQITDDPSVTDFDMCGFVTPGATNFLLDDLSDCNFIRTAMLCGDDVVLDAGDGFDSYIWVRDDNGNNQIDPTDTVLNDGDPDNDPSTLVVTETGTYIVDKIVADPCKGFKEILVVELFGSTQTNPIVDYFNMVNNDADVTNDIEGEIVQCSIDGDLLPKIFLCGINDTQLLQTNITDAQSIVWERLDESSCTAAPDDCANKNLSCTWSQVNMGSDYTADTAGKYRVIINYQNGCFSRFYFDVYQNTLDVQYNKTDIICTMDGSITITNLGSNYGFQLIDITNNTILVPFNANNGPNFTITTNGAYRVDVVQLDGSGNPISGACIFSTPDIGILDRDPQVDIVATSANCNAQGTIKIDVLNVEPNYTYILKRSDGTLIDDETAQPNNTHTFNVNAGDYIIEVSTDDGCFYTENVAVSSIPDPTVLALTTRDIGCTAGMISVTAVGGFPNPDYGFAIWSKNGTDLYATVGDIPGGAYQVEDVFTFGWRDTDNDGTDEYFPGEDGTYVFVVIDANGCFAFSNPATIVDNGAMTIAITDDSGVSCSGDNDAAITIVPTGGIGPFTYSIDGGTTTRSTPIFVNLSAGTYPIQVTDSSGCTIDLSHNIAEPFPLSASTGVSRDATCDPMGAEVRITNVVGGTAPYTYSFDGGGTYGASTIAVLPAGTYTVLVKDSINCTFSMEVIVEDVPPPPLVTLTPEVSYACNGSAIITAAPNINTYDYTFSLDGILNSPDPTSNVFTNIAPGTYTVSTTYISQTPPTPSLLLSEDFGTSTGNSTIPSPNTVGYFYEDQANDNTPSGAPIDNGRFVNDYEYAVTNQIARPFGAWVNPINHTDPTDTNGRYLVINVGTPLPGQVIYSKTINDIIPNRPLRVSLWIINLLRAGANTQLDPNLTIEILNPITNTVVQSIQTGIIPKNTGPNDWIEFATDFDPGTNPSLELVIRTEIVGNSGNDLAIDDITVFQVPEVCPLTVETPVVVVAGRVFASSVLNSTNVSCNGLTDGTITFEVENFNAVAGFEYSVDGGATYITSTTSPVTTAAIYGVGNHTILIHKADETTCAVSISQNITEPTAVVASATITTALSCVSGRATITASAVGGTPIYQYQLEDNLGGVLTPYQASSTFTNVAAGDYIIRARDNNLCEDPIDVALTVAPTNAVVFDVTPTNCYSGANDASIQINVTDGNGDYTFSINGGPWATPTPANATTYTFNNLASGTYTINVRDGSGCMGVLQTIVIDPNLTAIVDVVDISSCADGSITVTASGGDGNFAYAFVTTGTLVTAVDFGPSSTFAVTTGNDGGYDVYVRGNNAVDPYCQFMSAVTVGSATPITYTSTPTDPICHDGAGSIVVNITSGVSPYTIQIIDLDNGGASDQTNTNIVATTQSYFNLAPGNYTINVTDANGCTITDTPVNIVNPDELTGSVVPILPASCTSIDPLDYGFRFVGYPTTLGIVEFSTDGGLTWTGDNSVPGTSDVLLGYLSGISVLPSMRTVDGSGNTLCQTDLPRYIIPFPLDNLDITISTVVVGCNELQVTVQGTAGVPNYEYTYTNDPSTFNVATATWTAAIPGSHVWVGLIPGRTYIFYVRDDTGCVRQSNVNVNDITTNPIEITATYKPSCSGANDAEITYALTDTDGVAHPSMRWEFYDANTGTLVRANVGNPASIPTSTTITVSGLAPGEYYIVATEVDAGGVDACVSGSENLLVEELNPITATLNKLSDISCNAPGLISIENINGGGGTFTYTVTGPGSFVAIVATSDNPVSIPANSPVGNYNVTITDQFGCFTDLGPINLNLTLNPTIDSIVIDNCASPSSLTINATSGAAQILYSIDGGTTYVDNGGVFNNIAAGNHNIAIIDGNGCTDTDTVDVYPVLEANATLTKLLDCTATPNAEITINVTFGSGNYDYEVSNGLGGVVARTVLPSNPFVFAASIAEDYTITIYDNNTAAPECNRVFPITVPTAATPVSAIDLFTDVSCNGTNDGTITVSTTDNGVGPYTFEIISGSGSTAVFPISPTTFTNTSAVFNGLEGLVAPGITYTIRATGANGCSTDETQLILQPEPIANVNVTVVAFGCAVGNNPDFATITIDEGAITGGSGNYVRYEFIYATTGTTLQDGTNSSYTETNLVGGDYTINVYDDKGCIGTTTVVIFPFVTIDNATVTTIADITCAPGNDAQMQVNISIAPATATPNLEYTTTGTNIVYGQTNATGLFTGLGIGNYSITITNLDTNCVVETTYEVLDPDVIEVVATKLTDEECLNNGVDDGGFDFAISNYTGNYSYQVYDNSDNPVLGAGFSGAGNTATPLIISNLPGGVYYVRITETDAPFCETNSNAVTILAPEAPITATVSEQASPSCTNDQGSLLVDPEGGTAPYTIVLNNTTTAQTYTQNNVEAYILTGLSGGDYNITITDAMGCSLTDTITLSAPDVLVAAISATPLVCFNGSTATVTGSVNLRNVTPNYLYRLNRYDATGTAVVQTSAAQTATVFTGLNAGFYSITITDDVGCSDDTDIVEIVNPLEVAPLLIRTSPLTCTTGVELELSATGGSGSYEYSEDNATWSAMAGSSVNLPVMGVLGDGTYRYYVRDAVNGCASVLSNEIYEDPIDPLTLTIDTSAAFINCNGDNTASIYADAEGGLGNYMYALFTDASLNVGSRIAGPQSLGEFYNLTAGTYYVSVISEDCTTGPEQVVINEPMPLEYTEEIINVLCFGDDNGSITITLSGGSGGYQYAISPKLNQFDTENTFDELAAGDYTVIAQDQNGCFIELQYTITEPTIIEATGIATPEVCARDEDGTITLTIQGGTAPYSTRLSSESAFVQDRVVFTDLSEGNYIIFVEDVNGCNTDIVVTVGPGANLNAVVEPIYECTGDTPNNYVNITLEDPSVIGNVLYALDSTDPVDMQLNPDFRNSAPGAHYIAIAHSNGCVRTVDFEIENFEPLTLVLEQSGINQITATAEGGKPGYAFYFGDVNNGANNTYIINRTDTYVVTVTDENGCGTIANIFMEFIDIEIPNFFTPDGDGLNDFWEPKNQEAFPEILTIIFDRYGREVYRMGLNDGGWGGVYHESPLPTGDYWYRIKLRGANDDREFVGHFTLYR